MSARGDIVRRATLSEPTTLPEPWQTGDDEDALAAAANREAYRVDGATDADGQGILPGYVLDWTRTPHVVPAQVDNNWSRSSSGRFVNNSGKYESKGSGLARLQYPFGSGDPGLLVEAAGRTNHVLNAANPSGWTSAGTNGVTFNDKTSLHADEGSNSDVDAKEVVGGGAADDHIQESAGTFTGSDEVAYVKAEKTSSDKIGLEVRNTTSGNVVALLEYEFSTDTITTVSGSVAAENVRTLTTSGPNTGKTVHFQFRVAGGNAENVNGENRVIRVYPDRNANGNGTIHHHAQIEEALNATSPIVTGSSATTRAADDYQIDHGEWFNTNEGTWIVDIFPRYYNQFSTSRLWQIGSLRARLRWAVGVGATIRDEAGNQIVSIGPTQPFQNISIAYSVTPNEMRLSANGVSDKTAHDGSHLDKSSNTIVHNGQYIGDFTKIVYFPRALSESTLNSLTS